MGFSGIRKSGGDGGFKNFWESPDPINREYACETGAPVLFHAGTGMRKPKRLMAASGFDESNQDFVRYRNHMEI